MFHIFYTAPWPSRLAVAVLLQTRIQEASCSNLHWNTNYSDCDFHCAFLVNAMIVPQSSYDRFLTNPFPIHYSPIIISFDARCIAWAIDNSAK
jgi:hypothetical protein